MEHRHNAVTSFLVKYINVYSSQIYTTTHKNKLESAQFKSFLPHFGLAMWRWIICTVSIPSLYISMENTKQLTEVFKIVFFLYGVMNVPHTTHLVWTWKSGVWGSCWGLAQSTVVFASLHVVSWITKTLHVGSTGQYMRSQTRNSALLSLLGNSVCGHKGNILLLRNVTWYCLPVASVCNLLNQTYILTANLKFSTKPTYKIQVTHAKSPKFTSIPKF